jgi:hypothetical protein
MVYRNKCLTYLASINGTNFLKETVDAKNKTRLLNYIKCVPKI